MHELVVRSCHSRVSVCKCMHLEGYCKLFWCAIIFDCTSRHSNCTCQSRTPFVSKPMQPMKLVLHQYIYTVGPLRALSGPVCIYHIQTGVISLIGNNTNCIVAVHACIHCMKWDHLISLASLCVESSCTLRIQLLPFSIMKHSDPLFTKTTSFCMLPDFM